MKCFRSRPSSSAKIFAAVKRPLGTRVLFCSQVHPFHSCEMAASFPRLEILHFAVETPFGRVFRSCKTTLWHTSAISQPHALIRSCEMVAKSPHLKILQRVHHEWKSHRCTPISATIGHILITYQSSFHLYHMSFQILGRDRKSVV